jgi:hypothetical protein
MAEHVHFFTANDTGVASAIVDGFGVVAQLLHRRCRHRVAQLTNSRFLAPTRLERRPACAI